MQREFALQYAQSVIDQYPASLQLLFSKHGINGPITPYTLAAAYANNNELQADFYAHTRPPRLSSYNGLTLEAPVPEPPKTGPAVNATANVDNGSKAKEWVNTAANVFTTIVGGYSAIKAQQQANAAAAAAEAERTNAAARFPFQYVLIGLAVLVVALVIILAIAKKK